jgi:inner membrane protein
MDPVTHGIVGLAIAAVTGEPAAVNNPYAIGCLLGAVIPDGDIVMQIKGHYSYLKNHRGVSHSIPFAFLYGGAIALLLSVLFPGAAFLKLFLYSIVGCLSHLILDITNSYGAKIFWPFFNKKYTTDLLLVYDPVLFILSLAVIMPSFRAIIHPVIVLFLFAIYIIFRTWMKIYVKKTIKINMDCGGDIKFIRILPSIIGLLKWHFIVKFENKWVVGEIKLFSKKIKIIDVLENLDTKLYDAIKNTEIAEFFGEFTPIFHVTCKKVDFGYEFNFTDLRYYMAKDFLHHATAVLDENFTLVSSLFQPYKKAKKVEV